MNPRLFWGQLKGKVYNLGSGFRHGWTQSRAKQFEDIVRDNMPKGWNRSARVGASMGKHPIRYASGAIGAGGAVYGIQRYRKQDPEMALYLGGSRGRTPIPARRVDQWMRQEVNPRLTGYTVEPAKGVWKGQAERTRILRYFGPRTDIPKMRQIAGSYKRRFGQDSVLFTRQNPQVQFL